MYPHPKTCRRRTPSAPARRPARRRRRSERSSAVASGGEQSALVLVIRRKVRFAATVSGIREPVLRGDDDSIERRAQFPLYMCCTIVVTDRGVQNSANCCGMTKALATSFTVFPDDRPC